GQLRATDQVVDRFHILHGREYLVGNRAFVRTTEQRDPYVILGDQKVDEARKVLRRPLSQGRTGRGMNHHVVVRPQFGELANEFGRRGRQLAAGLDGAPVVVERVADGIDQVE